MRNIQQIYTGESNLYIVGWNDQTKELSFRSSRNPENLQTEVVRIEGNFVYTSLYHFHKNYLQQFIALNEPEK